MFADVRLGGYGMGTMPRTERLAHRVTPELLDALDMARGLVPRSRWIEAALEEKLARVGVPVATPPAPLGDEPPAARRDWSDPASYPRRPAPRLTGGRKKR